AIDVGGTFTDTTPADAAPGATWGAKTPSTPGDLSTGFITAIRKVLTQAGRASSDILRVFHWTTTATNTILEGRTPPIALVTTAGFKYVLEDYGVALDPATLDVDKTATDEERRRRAGPLTLIDRGPGLARAEARWREMSGA